jgi:hypothetical protein
MVSIKTFRELALSLPEATEAPHFDKAAFKVKKIFATLDEPAKRACVMLSPVDQSSFCTFDKRIIYPVPNKWGLQGATYIELSKVSKTMLLDALTSAYIDKAPKGLAAAMKAEREKKYGNPDS